MRFERIQGADFGQTVELVFAELWNAQREIVDAGEGAGTHDGTAGFLAKAFGVPQPEAPCRPAKSLRGEGACWGSSFAPSGSGRLSTVHSHWERITSTGSTRNPC